jgi:cytochrome c-type biogenesis protein CcmH/NrfG
MLRSILAATLAVLFSSPATAVWHKATSRHFIIYSEEDPARLKAYAEKLERFDSAVRLMRGMKDPPIGDGNRLTVFVVKDVKTVAELKPVDRDVRSSGFYLGRGSGSIAVVPRSLPARSTSHPDVVFQHEYAHHLMFADLTTPIPMWLVEGFAEFYSTGNINADGSVGLGEAVSRSRILLQRDVDTLSIDDLLAGNIASSTDRSALYAQGWLLTHYLTFNAARRDQLDTYLAHVADGRSSVEAGRMAFGDLRKLGQDLRQYVREERFPYLTLPAERIRSAEVAVERLGAGADAVMPLYMRLQTRVAGSGAAAATEARTIAAANPGDPLVAMTLAEAEWVAKNYKASETAADRAIALLPQSAEAHIWKGRALLSQAETGIAGVTFLNARGWFNRANRLDPENPEPLLYFYRTFQGSGGRPTVNAIAALHYAAQLAPQDHSLRLQSARLYLADGKSAEARQMLAAVAYSPHGGRISDQARELLQRIGADGGGN